MSEVLKSGVSAAAMRADDTPVLPPHVKEAIDGLPPNLTRKHGAMEIKRVLGYPVSHRSMEAWPLPTRHVNGHAIVPTEVLFRVAYAKFAAAPVVMGGRRNPTGQKSHLAATPLPWARCGAAGRFTLSMVTMGYTNR
jgi:hypothetical protein